MLFHRRQLRSWAARVLFLWLFGVWAGVANACLTSPAMQADDEIAAQHALHSLEDEADHEGAGAIEHHHDAGALHASAGDAGHHSSSIKSNCTDFCDRASVSLPSLKSALDDVQAHALQPPVVAVIVTLPAFEPVQQWVPRRDGVRAPPIPIAFLRLAL